ncbi:MAG: CoA-binding protein [Betaproteobacteria bacterium]|nr:MAG: CoA-binding protein [Betaproteobacteria bacterium]
MSAAQRSAVSAMQGARGAMQALLQPRSVAILGCSSDLNRISGRPLRYFLAKGYQGALYPVNPNQREIAGLRCYPEVGAIPGTVDLAIVAVAAERVIESMRQLVAKGVPAAVIFSSGFAEMGEAGAAAQRELLAIARAGGVRFCGPNAVGVVNAFEAVTASFSEYLEGALPVGPIGFVSQSGAFGTAIAVLARERQLGLGYYVNTGNEADIDVADALGFIVEDPRIRVVAGYVEGIRDGRKLLAVAERAMALGKPMVLTKVGRSAAGARAAASHTGALAGADAVLDGVLRQKGVIRADDEEQMIDLVEMFAHCRLPKGPNLGIVSQSGGAGVLACDRAEAHGLRVPILGDATQDSLRQVLPQYAAVANPVDLTGLSLAEPELIRRTMKQVLADPAVDIGLLWVRLMDKYAGLMTDIITDVGASTRKTFVVSWLAPPPVALKALRERGTCVARGAAQAMDALAGLVRYGEARKRWLDDAPAREADAGRPPVPPLPAGAGAVSSVPAAAILHSAGVRLVPFELARDADTAAAAARRLGYPVALKIESRDIAHKTEAGGVLLGVADEKALRTGFAQILRSVRERHGAARIDGVVVQKMLDPGVEMVIGVQQDEAFGPIVMVGFGGILVEVMQDVVFAAAPLTFREADTMLSSLKAAPVLQGVRGKPPVDRAALCNFLVNVSRLAAAAGPRLAELDLNPVMAGADGSVAVDWLLIQGSESE